MRIQPYYTQTVRQTRFPRDAGLAGRPGAKQREMRSSNGSTWLTEGHYTLEEAKLFICAEPVECLP